MKLRKPPVHAALRCGLALALVPLSPPALADDWLGARSVGRGGTGLADDEDAAAVLANTPVLSLRDQYTLVLGGVRGPDDTWLGRVAAVDTRTSVVTMGATYTYRYDDIAPTGDSLPGWKVTGEALVNPTSHQGVSLSFAYPFASRQAAVGIVGRYDWGDSQNDGQSAGFNFGAGIAGKPSETVTLATSVQNILDLDYADTRRLVDVGVRWEPGPFLGVEAQARTEWMGDPFEESLAEHVGIDVYGTEWLALRAGWQHEHGLHQVGGGLGLLSDKAAIDYGLSGEIGEDPVRLWHSLDIRIEF